MLKFVGVNGYDQMVITKGDSQSGSDNKWGKQKREVFSSSETPKILVTQRHVYAAHLNSLIVLDTKPLIDKPVISFQPEQREIKIDNHSSPITCFCVEEEALLVCSCSDEHVFLSKWDGLLGHWDTKGISEGDGRILSCSVAFTKLDIYITLFKTDVLIVYKIEGAHPPAEQGPFILNSIGCFITLEKVKELTTWSRSIFINGCLNIIGIASGNTVSVKLWEVSLDKSESPPQPIIKLKSHRMVSYLKMTAAADLVIEKDNAYLLVVGNDGVSEVFTLSGDGLNIIYRFKIEEPESPENVNLNATSTNLQVDSRILCAKFFLVDFTLDQKRGEKGQRVPDFGGGGDAKFDYESYEKLTEEEKEEIVGKDCEEVVGATLCPKLILVAVTTKGVFFMDVVNGHLKPIVSHGELLKDDSIFIQNAEMTVNIKTKDITLGLQSCLARIVFSRRFRVSVEQPLPQKISEASLIPREALNSKSVLRKRIKSPPRQVLAYPNIKKDSAKSPGTLPNWARSRSRPQLKSSTTKSSVRSSSSVSARSLSSASSSFSWRTSTFDSDNFSERGERERQITVPSTGSYESDDIAFNEVQKITVPNTIPHGISLLRIASTTNGKFLAFGGNFSPLVIMKTKPFQNFKTFKDISKATSVHFNFEGNLLVTASSDCRTSLVDWKTSKELLSFDFTTKFNEHVHTQFYFMDKFIIQPEENRVVLYSYAKRDTGYIRLKAGEFPLPGQTITALSAANQFYSNVIVAGLSNKSIQVLDTNSEKVSLTIPNTHTKPVSCIRINEAPQGINATQLCDIFMTSTFSNFDPIKLWDLRSAKCIMRISDMNQTIFVPTSRPNMSPCGRYIVSGLEDNAVSFYDVRKIKNRLHTEKKVGSTVLDCAFDTNHPMVWSGCRNGSVLNFHIP